MVVTDPNIASEIGIHNIKYQILFLELIFSFPHITAIVIFIIFILVNSYFLLIKKEHDTTKPLPYLMPNLIPQCLCVEGRLVTQRNPHHFLGFTHTSFTNSQSPELLSHPDWSRKEYYF